MRHWLRQPTKSRDHPHPPFALSLSKGRSEHRPRNAPDPKCYPHALACASLLLALLPNPAAAQWGGSLTLSSQARLRGQPVSGHHPVAELELVRDSGSGFYIGGSAALVLSHGAEVQPFAFRQYVGIVRPLSPAVSVDLGLVHSGYTEYSGVTGGGSYSEAYVGLIGRHLSGRLSLSPGYFRRDDPTLYIEVEGHLDIDRKASVFARLGKITYLSDRADRPQRSAVDWRVGARHALGPIDVEAAWTGYVQQRAPDHPSYRRGSAVVIAASFGF